MISTFIRSLFDPLGARPTIISFALLCLNFTIAQQGSAQWLSVFEEGTGKALPFVSISTPDGYTYASTNESGKADLTAFNGKPVILISCIGYKTIKLSYAQLADKNFEVTLSADAFDLETAVIAVNRFEQPRSEVPVKVTSIDRKEIALQNPQTAADLLNASGDVFIQKSQLGGGSPMIRGFSTNRLLISVDGVRMNTAIFRSGNLQNIISLDPFAIERTEVVFGPSSVNYGSDAIGGVMSFQTLTPTVGKVQKNIESAGNAVLRYSSANNERTTHFDFRMSGYKWGLVSSFSFTDFDDLRMGSYGPEEYLRPSYTQYQDSTDVVVANTDPQVQRPTGYSQTNMMHKFVYQPTEFWTLSYALHHSATSNYPRYDRLIRLRNGLPRSGTWEYGPQIWLMNMLSATHKKQTRLYDEMSIRAAYQYFEESRIDRDFNDTERRERVEEVDAYSLNLDLRKYFNEQHAVYYGAELVMNQVNSLGLDTDISTGITLQGPARYPQSEWMSYAVFASYHYMPSEEFTLIAGARYNGFDIEAAFDTTFYPFPFSTASLNQSAITGSAGAAWKPTDRFEMSLNLATGFRSPNIDDLGKVFDSEPGAVVIPNPDLQAEYAYNAELGMAKRFGNRLEIDAAAYYTILDQALVRRDFALNGLDSIIYDGELSRVQAIQNAANAYVYGVQAGFHLNMGKGFYWKTRLNYQFGEEELEDGSTDRLRHAAPAFGRSALGYTSGKASFELYTQFSDELSNEEMPEEEKSKDFIYAMDENGEPYSPAWYTLNIRAEYKFNNYFSVTGGLENITDQRYRPYSSGIVAPGRNIVLAFRAGF